MVFNYKTESTILKDRKAFTLVELLVVVAVLALLASIVFSNLTGAREQAKISNALSFQSNMHNLLGADLVGWWNFDQENAKDSSGYGYNGSIHGLSSFVDGVPGTKGKAMKFDGFLGNDGIRVTNYNPVTLLSQLTITAWVNSTHEGLSFGPIASKNYREFQPKIDKGYFQVSLWPDGVRQDCYSSTENNKTTKDEWNLLIFSWDGITGKVEKYIDGKSSQSPCTGNSWKGMIELSSTPLYIGGYAGDYKSYAYDGLIDDVRIYSRALTAYEVQTLYAQTKDNYLAEEQ